jgi:hypothetical protein
MKTDISTINTVVAVEPEGFVSSKNSKQPSGLDLRLAQASSAISEASIVPL